MSDTAHKRPWWHRVLRGMAFTLLALCLVLAGGTWWLLGTTSGARWMVATALPYAQERLPANLQLDIGEIETDTLAHIRIGHLSLSDAEGIWFKAEGVALDWHPSALLEGTFHAETINAQRIHFVRPPAGEETPQTGLREQVESAQQTLRQLPEMLQGISLPPLHIEQLTANEIALDSVLVAAPSRFRLTGSLNFTQTPAQMQIDMQSLEGIETSAQARMSGPPGEAALDIHWQEAQGGMLGTLLQLTPPAPAALDWQARIEGDSWRHGIFFKADDTLLAQAGLHLPTADEQPISMQVEVLEPARFGPLSTLTSPLTLEAQMQAEQATIALTTDSMALGENQTLRDAVINANLMLDDDPLFALNAQATGSLQSAEAEPQAVELTLQATGDATSWNISQMAASLGAMRATSTGQLNLEEGSAKLEGKLDVPQLLANYHLNASELFETPQGEAQVVVQEIRQPLPAPLDQVVAAPLTVSANTKTADGPLPNITFEIASTNINGGGNVYPSAQEDQMVAETTLTVGGLPLPLTLSANFRASGAGHVEARSQNLTAVTDYALSDSAVSLSNLSVDAGRDIALTGQATIQTNSGLASGTLKGHVKSTRPLQELGLTVPLIEAAQGEVSIRLAETNGVQRAEADIKTGALSMEGEALGENVVLEARATLPQGKAPQMNAVLIAESLTKPVAVEKLTLQIEGADGPMSWKLNAAMPKASLIADGSLTMDTPFTLTIAHLQAEWVENSLVAEKPVTATYGEGEIGLQNLLLSLNNTSTIAGDARLTPEQIGGSLAIKGLPLAALPLQQLQSMKGQVNGTLRLSGTPTDPDARLVLDIDGLQQNYPQMANLHNQPLTMRLRANLQRQMLEAQLSANAPDAESFAAANLSLPVTVSLAPDNLAFAPRGPVDAALRADLILGPFLPLFLPDGVYGSGHFIADIAVDGTLDNPQLRGTVDLHSGRVEVLQAGTLINDIDLQLEARDSQLIIHKGNATDSANGTLTFSGNVGLEPTLPMDLQAAFNQFVALRHPSATATLSGEVSLEGDLTEALLQSDLEVNSANITIRKSGTEEVTELQVVEVESLEAPLEEPEDRSELTDEERAAAREQRRRDRPFARNLALDVNIGADNQIFLDGFGLNAELKGNMQVIGTAARPELGGKMETVRGRWEFFGRTFFITRGVAILSEDNLSAPLIDIRAEADAEDVLAIAQIRGTTNNPKIEFSSIPVLPEDEILSRVMFGENLNNISPYQALQLANMLRSLSGSGDGSSLNPLSALQDTLGIDELKINSESGDTADTTVGVGKYLRENVYLEVEGGAAENSGKVSVEVDLTPNISVETETRQNAESAVRLNYKYDY